MYKNVLIAAKSKQAAQSLEKLLQAEGFDFFSFAETYEEAKNQIIYSSFDLVLINAPISNSSGLELAVYAIKNSDACVMIIVKQDYFDDVCRKVEDYGIFTIEKPMNKSLFHQALKLSQAAKRRVMQFESENYKLKNQVEEIKILNRAKSVLMKYLSMSEETAHKYIEKQAMDMRVSKSEIAKQVLTTYEN